MAFAPLAQEKIPRGVVRPMDPGMTVGATSIEIPDGVQDRRRRRMARRDVARVADPRHAHLEQLRVIGAVRLVAVRAVLHHRWMLEQEWPAPLRVAAHAILGYRAVNQLTRVRAAVRVVA